MAKEFNIQVVIEAIDKLTRPLRRMTGSIRRFTRAARFDRVTQSFRKLGSETQQLIGRMTILTGASLGLFAAFTKPASDLENLRFRLNNLYGSMKEGKRVFDFVKNYAKESPYDFDVITTSLLTLKNQNFDDLDQFTTLMDYLAVRVPDQHKAAGVVMQFAQAFGKGKLQQEDMRLIAQQIPLYDMLGKILGKTRAQLFEMSKDGLLTNKVMLDLIAEMGRQGGDKQGIFDLWTTKLSNLGDVWKIFAADVMNTKLGDISLFKEMKDDLQWVTDMLSEGITGEKMTEVANVLNDIYQVMKELLPVIFETIKGVLGIFKAFSTLVGGTQNAIKVLMGLMALPVVVSLVQLGISIYGAATAIWGFIAALEVGGASIAAWASGLAYLSAGPIAAVIAGVLLLVGLGISIYNNWNPNKSLLNNLWDGFLVGVQDAINLVTRLINLLPGVNIPSMTYFDDRRGENFGQNKRPQFNRVMDQLSPNRLGMPSNANFMGSKDKLDVNIKVDSEGRAKVASVDHSGSSDINFEANMGLMTATG